MSGQEPVRSWVSVMARSMPFTRSPRHVHPIVPPGSSKRLRRAHGPAPTVRRDASKLGTPPLPPLGDPGRPDSPAPAARPGTRPVRGAGLRGPGPLYDERRAPGRVATDPRILELPRDERADLCPRLGPRPRRLVLQPRRRQRHRGTGRPCLVPPALSLRPDEPDSGVPRPRGTTLGHHLRLGATLAWPRARLVLDPGRAARAGHAGGRWHPGALPGGTLHPLCQLTRSALSRPGSPYALSTPGCRSYNTRGISAGRVGPEAPDAPPLAHYASGVRVEVFSLSAVGEEWPMQPGDRSPKAFRETANRESAAR